MTKIFIVRGREGKREGADERESRLVGGTMGPHRHDQGLVALAHSQQESLQSCEEVIAACEFCFREVLCRQHKG